MCLYAILLQCKQLVMGTMRFVPSNSYAVSLPRKRAILIVQHLWCVVAIEAISIKGMKFFLVFVIVK